MWHLAGPEEEKQAEPVAAPIEEAAPEPQAEPATEAEPPVEPVVAADPVPEEPSPPASTAAPTEPEQTPGTIYFLSIPRRARSPRALCINTMSSNIFLCKYYIDIQIYTRNLTMSTQCSAHPVGNSVFSEMDHNFALP